MYLEQVTLIENEAATYKLDAWHRVSRRTNYMYTIVLLELWITRQMSHILHLPMVYHIAPQSINYQYFLQQAWHSAPWLDACSEENFVFSTICCQSCFQRADFVKTWLILLVSIHWSASKSTPFRPLTVFHFPISWLAWMLSRLAIYLKGSVTLLVEMLHLTHDATSIQSSAQLLLYSNTKLPCRIYVNLTTTAIQIINISITG